jgi:hypothetical protein
MVCFNALFKIKNLTGLIITNSLQMPVHWLLFPGVSYCDNRECIFMFDYEKEHQNTWQSDLYSGATLLYISYFEVVCPSLAICLS